MHFLLSLILLTLLLISDATNSIWRRSCGPRSDQSRRQRRRRRQQQRQRGLRQPLGIEDIACGGDDDDDEEDEEDDDDDDVEAVARVAAAVAGAASTAAAVSVCICANNVGNQDHAATTMGECDDLLELGGSDRNGGGPVGAGVNRVFNSCHACSRENGPDNVAAAAAAGDIDPALSLIHI